jgi:ribosome biogenesis GTPase
MHLEDLGWSEQLQRRFDALEREDLRPGRVIWESHELYRLATAGGELTAQLTGRLRYAAQGRDELPVVGDWVAAAPFDDSAVIHAVLPRASHLARRAPGRRQEVQLLAANVDLVLVVTAVAGDLNPRRLERYLAMAREGGCQARVVLSKADLATTQQLAAARQAAAAVAAGAPVLAVSAVDGTGLEELEARLAPGRTAALLGSSGVGKSTLVNHLAGDRLQEVAEIRAADGKGRHTTTRRQLFRLPSGVLLLDTPGLRELGLTGEGAAGAFTEIEALAAACRFRDCRHDGEPGCAVAAAVAAGELDGGRLASYRKLLREQASQAERQALGANAAEKRKWKAILEEAGVSTRRHFRPGELKRR